MTRAPSLPYLLQSFLKRIGIKCASPSGVLPPTTPGVLLAASPACPGHTAVSHTRLPVLRLPLSALSPCSGWRDPLSLSAPFHPRGPQGGCLPAQPLLLSDLPRHPHPPYRLSASLSLPCCPTVLLRAPSILSPRGVIVLVGLLSASAPCHLVLGC